jgi:hypothetical protein
MNATLRDDGLPSASTAAAEMTTLLTRAISAQTAVVVDERGVDAGGAERERHLVTVEGGRRLSDKDLEAALAGGGPEEALDGVASGQT